VIDLLEGFGPIVDIRDCKQELFVLPITHADDHVAVALAWATQGSQPTGSPPFDKRWSLRTSLTRKNRWFTLSRAIGRSGERIRE
jgi:hypothetical protein